MTVNIKVWSDYVCPFCLLAEEPLLKAVEGEDVEIEWMPFELRPHPVPTLHPEGEYLQTVWKRAVYPMARRMKVDIKLPDVCPQPYTGTAFEGYQFAKEHGKGTAYTPRVLRAFFQEGLDIGRIDVLTGIAAELGLPAEEFRRALEDGTYRQAHQDALATAEKNLIQSVPTIIVGGTHRIEGVPHPAQLRKAIDAAQAEAAMAENTAAEGAAAEAGGAPADWGATCGIDGC
ncbi:2-hydroxychromene-2-carboxylate isomerase [Streptomyces agglomeratus]|uniref:2-hydroxychromene-2-carboxylate isomerase n=1 Tax=Streptomyces agglomeratus TaxID=285458 RepID=A0A1E5P786_9ACTN|nr:DsbA family oxidoreductase [Streptomyces agglomeratus]OEJ25406.1 2-hydroxychromene-2-carboxylate isomerase [Streptomyces agglomeratus]OEJ53107.1 2-hydroxychromene-2-carboxylate isomerase [Streptomyces agglomeratus]